MEEPASIFERAVLAALPDAVLVVDESVSVIWGNPAAEALFGLTVEEAAGISGLELVHPDDLAAAASSMVSVQSKDVGTPVEIRVRASDGWRLVEVIGRPLGEGQTLLALRDLTQRRLWEVAGNQAELARVIVQNAASMTLLVDADGIIRTSSGGLTRLLGVDQEHALGRPFTDLACADDRQLLLDAMEASRPGEPVLVEARLTRLNGESVPFAFTIVDLRDDPTVLGLVISGHDVSDRARAEAELRSALSLLQATLDATADGILVVDRGGQVSLSNEQFMEIVGRSPSGTGPWDSSWILEEALKQVVDPQGFLDRVRELEANPEAISHDEVRFTDGRILERDSRPQRVGGEIVGRVWSFRDVTATLRLQEELAHQASHDPLTGLANQTLIRDRIDHALAHLQRRGGRLAVCFVDLDDFKTINDSLGHDTGDELLCVVAERLLECVRGADTVARLGGDEFAVLIEDVGGDEDVEQVAERISDAVHRPIALAGRDIVVSASVGIAYGGVGASVNDLLRNADLAMYTAKADGKNRHRAYAPSMFHAAIERLETEASLRGAAARGELIVHYQPIVDARRHLTQGFEALVRWQHPERGLLAPGAFIEIAEQVGLIDEIGRHVLEVACAEASTWAPVGPGSAAPSISVNLSPPQLLDPRFPDRLNEILRSSGLPADRLVLELTEGALMADPLAAKDALVRLADLGCRLAVDDFGTGYSSLAYLRQFPIHILKVDRSFVMDLGRDGKSLAHAIIQLARNLGLTSVAEGVETESQAVALRDFGCRLAQGYLFGRPADAEAARARLAAERFAIVPAGVAGSQNQ